MDFALIESLSSEFFHFTINFELVFILKAEIIMRNILIFISRLMLQIYVMLKAKIKMGIANMSMN